MPEPKKRSKRKPERFCVRVHDGSTMAEIGTWVWSVRTGETLFRLERGQKAGGAA